MKTGRAAPGISRLVVLLAAMAPLCLVAPAHALKPVRGYPARPSDYGIIYREVTFTARDSIVLHGWFYPAQDTSGIANDLVGAVVPVPPERRPGPRPYAVRGGTPAPTVVVCDGDAGNMADLILCAYNLSTRGFNVLTFDWRGFGESAEWRLDPNRLCASEFLLDYDAAIDFVLGQPEVNPADGAGGRARARARVGVLGFSTGAYLSFAEAAKRREVGAFAGRALITSFDDLLPILRKLDPGRPWAAPPGYPLELLPAQAAARGFRTPAFLVVGKEDKRTPPWMSRRIYAQLMGPKELWVVPKAEHGGMTAPELVDYPRAFERLAAFYRKHLP